MLRAVSGRLQAFPWISSGKRAAVAWRALAVLVDQESPTPLGLPSLGTTTDPSQARPRITYGPERLQPRRAGKNRLLRSRPAETSDTSTPTGKISANVIGRRNIGFAYWTLNAAMSALSFASDSALAPFAFSLAMIAFAYEVAKSMCVIACTASHART